MTKASLVVLLLVFGSARFVHAQIGALDATKFAGADIGQKINNAAASCQASRVSPSTLPSCWIALPPTTPLTFSTPIIFIDNETLQCPAINGIDNSGAENTGQLSYTGSGTAITMAKTGGRLVGCDLSLSSSALAGILVGGYSNYLRDVGVRGGGTSTYMVHISGGTSGVATEDSHVENSRISNFVGTGIGVDNANDTFLTNVTAYGMNGNTTSTTLLVDSGAGGLIIDNFVGGSSGLHGFWERYTLGGRYPTFIFANNFECDRAASDCFLFDSSLGSANVDATFVNSWAAAAGAAGMHISGGSGIHIGSGTRIRVNAYDGITIDGGREVGVVIEGTYIQGNNQANVGKHGITINGHPNSVTIVGNHIGNYPEVGGNQGYGVWAISDVEGLVVTNNNCGYNNLGCANLSAVVPSKLVYSQNIAVH